MPPPFAAPATTAAPQHGLTLLETLVAMVILSLGVLGMVGLQAWSLSAQREARLSSQVQSMARELAEMMRSNRQIATQANPALNPYLGVFSSGALQAPTPNYCLNEAAKGCPNPTAVAQAHLTDWLERLAQLLPSARVSICLDDQPYDTRGQPRWACSPSDSALPHIKIGWSQRSTDRQDTSSGALISAHNAPPRLVLPVHSGRPEMP